MPRLTPIQPGCYIRHSSDEWTLKTKITEALSQWSALIMLQAKVSTLLRDGEQADGGATLDFGVSLPVKR